VSAIFASTAPLALHISASVANAIELRVNGARSERMFGTLQDRLPGELALGGIHGIEAANRFIR
jgi:hypothetical protein